MQNTYVSVSYMAHHVRYSGGLGMANHEGAGDGLSVTAFDWPRILHTFFRLKKYVAEGLSDEFKRCTESVEVLKEKSYQKTTSTII